MKVKSNLSFHPGRSGSFYLGSNKGPLLASFGEINPIIVNQLELDHYSPCGFEVYLDNISNQKESQKDAKQNYVVLNFKQLIETLLLLSIRGCANKLIKEVKSVIRY